MAVAFKHVGADHDQKLLVIDEQDRERARGRGFHCLRRLGIAAAVKGETPGPAWLAAEFHPLISSAEIGF